MNVLTAPAQLDASKTCFEKYSSVLKDFSPTMNHSSLLALVLAEAVVVAILRPAVSSGPHAASHSGGWTQTTPVITTRASLSTLRATIFLGTGGTNFKVHFIIPLKQSLQTFRTYDTIIYVATIKCTFYFLVHLFEVCLKTFETVGKYECRLF